MSLISAKNLFAPLTNKLHMLSILFVMIVFGVFRLATGGIEVVHRPTTETPDSRIGSDRQLGHTGIGADPRGTNNNMNFDPREEIKRLAEQGRKSQIDPNAAKPNGGKDLLDEMIPQKPQGQPSDNQKGRGLQDIEQALGLK